MLDRLEAAGHIYRETYTEDRCRTLVRVVRHLPPSGQPTSSLLQLAVGQMVEAYYQGFKCWSGIYTNLVREEQNN